MVTKSSTARYKRRYYPAHRQRRDLLAPLVASGTVPCARCGELIRPGEPWDLGHVDGDDQVHSGPEHQRCNRSTASRLWDPPPPELEPERDGLPADDDRWSVPWLKSLRRVPRDATWPRYMTVPHPRAVGSLGPDFIGWAKDREGKPLRWWQRLAATRLLEVDSRGELVWETFVLTMARQLGKSWLLRELILWRMHQGERFGEPQDIVHTGKDLQVCQEIQLRARWWAKERPDDYKVREVNGQEQILFRGDNSRWMLRAKESAYGLSVSVAAVDEAWKVKPETLNESIIPTMVERAQPQLWLISTAHRLSTVLMLRRRALALEDLEIGDGDLLIEWSAPHGVSLDDMDAWRLASPHWSPQRQRTVGKQLEALRAGEIEDPEEPDPEASFKSQWLNQWPRRLVVQSGNTEPLLPAGLWITLEEPGLSSSEPVFIAVEDDYGRGAGVAAVVRHDDGRLEVDGWECDDWDSAIRDVRRLCALREIRELHVGASMMDRVPSDSVLPIPIAAINAQTSAGLSVFRDLAAGGMLVHDSTTSELDRAIAQTQVRESPSGLQIAKGPRALVKALAWAVAAAHKPARVFAVR